MEDKWKCTICDTYNMSDRDECFVCGHRRETAATRCVTGEVVSRTTSEGFFGNIMKKLRTALGFDESETHSSSFEVRTSKDSSHDAYVEAVELEMPETVEPARSIPAEPSPVEAPDRTLSSSYEETEPWPEHRILFRPDRFAARHCCKITRSELGGVRGYEMHLDDGSKRFININNLKILGLAENA